MSIRISKTEARRFMLSHLLLAGGKLSGAEGVMRVFDRLKCIQFDPLAVAGRNHDIALQARIKDYTPSICETLLYTERRLLDAWDKKMCVIRTADLPLFRPLHRQLRERLGGPGGPVYAILDEVRARVAEHGPTTAKMLNISGEAEWGFGTGNWGSPNPGRVALEAMLAWGELVVANKNKGVKAYDFTVKLLPDEIVSRPDPHATDGAYIEWRVLRRVTSAGLIKKGRSNVWMFSTEFTPRERSAAVYRLLRGGRLLEIGVEGLKQTYYACAEDWERYAAEGCEPDGGLRFIAPLDNLMWDKQLIRELFDFDYHWEVYEPPHKRKFGYYVTPILAGDGFIGRAEPVFKKGDEAMRVKGLWWESDAAARKYGRRAIRLALEDYARFLGARGYVMEA